MGLGPNHTSLLDRTGQPAQVWRDPFAMMLEQQDRKEARQLKAIWYAQHRAQPRKPEAPVDACDKIQGIDRRWIWIGETIESKGMIKGGVYKANDIRNAGFKLPRLEKHKK